MNGVSMMIIEGNVFKAEVKEAAENRIVSTLHVGVTRTFRDSDGFSKVETDFYPCEFYGEGFKKPIENHLVGNTSRPKVRIIGRMKTGKSDGRKIAYIVGEYLSFTAGGKETAING